MAGDPNNLVWIDMEMTGLQPDSDRIIEIAMLVTDPQLAVLAAGPLLVVHQPDEVLEAMDSWNKSTHKKTGLIERVRASRLTESDALRQIALIEQQARLQMSLDLMPKEAWLSERRQANEQLLREFQEATHVLSASATGEKL